MFIYDLPILTNILEETNEMLRAKLQDDVVEWDFSTTNIYAFRSTVNSLVIPFSVES